MLDKGTKILVMGQGHDASFIQAVQVWIRHNSGKTSGWLSYLL